MIIQGANGSVEIFDHHIVLRRSGMINLLNGLMGEKSIPLSSITAVQFGDRWIQLSVVGETPKRIIEIGKDPNAVTFTSEQRPEFERLRGAIQSAINIPSLASLAAQYARGGRVQPVGVKRPAHPTLLIEGSPQDGDRLAPPNTDAWDHIRPWEPKSFSQWMGDRSWFTRFIIKAMLLSVALIVPIAVLVECSRVPSAANEQDADEQIAADNGVPVELPKQAKAMTVLPRWTGQYAGQLDGAEGTLGIRKGPQGEFSISLGMAGPSCVGGFDVTVERPDGNQLVMLLPPVETGDHCQVTLTHRGDRIAVGEDGCGSYHGASCAFVGDVNRQK